MANILKVTPEEVVNKASEINICEQAMGDTLRATEQQIRSLLESSWAGPASQAYLGKYNEMVMQINRSFETIESYVEKLSKAAKTYAETESALTAEHNQLSAGNLFNA